MFLINKYSKWYFNIIEKATARPITAGYTEKHHIIPKSIGGNNTKVNLVVLTAREHFICHLLLPKMTDGNYQRKMLFAFKIMSAQSGTQQRYINSRLFQNIKHGITHSSESKKKMSASHIGLIQTAETVEKRVSKIRGKESPTKGATIHNEESRNKISQAQKGIIDKLTPDEKLLRGKKSFHRADTYTATRSKNISNALTGKAKSKEHREAMMKTYKFISPQGEEFIYLGLATGCAFHGFNCGSVKNNLMNGKPYKGWKILYGK